MIYIAAPVSPKSQLSASSSYSPGCAGGLFAGRNKTQTRGRVSGRTAGQTPLRPRRRPLAVTKSPLTTASIRQLLETPQNVFSLRLTRSTCPRTRRTGSEKGRRRRGTEVGNPSTGGRREGRPQPRQLSEPPRRPRPRAPGAAGRGGGGKGWEGGAG